MTNPSSFRASALALGILLSATAQAAAPNEYDALLHAKKYAEAEKLALARLAQDPGNAEAMAARSNAIIGLEPVRIDEAVNQAEKCIAAHPANGKCHLALGQALGTKAMIKGIMASLGSAGTIRDSIKKAVELDPADVEARFTMLDFYMMAPFVVGGGKGKAETFARETASVNAEAGKLMTAKLLLQGGDIAKAEAAAVAVRPGSDADLLDRHEDFLSALAAHYISEKKYADAERVLRDSLKRYPASGGLGFMSGRLQQEQGKHREAIAAFELVAANMPRPYVFYRLGKSFQTVGDKAKAIASYERAVAAKSGLPPSQRSDAEQQLKALRG